ncbi:ABC transporter ATP-binding protein [Ancylobacter defluvii]|uniref:ABC transporter ATP-binding protein n=1 Tax=Ancylobacter defluvii TaxID=1282440 RepID=A0A9W6JSA3_9HYPH|nr:ABC transporter ATP-binding protein [Ancylobacter defluvii]MBS7586160.1 ABC transporter ATP-binding protein [Ancylobacter defluvii]GLK82357.1 ABC transporter ATP-binding protein [Ancylobacter defluvii]
MAAASRLDLAGLTVGYGARRIIDGLDLGGILASSVTALVGPNAAGKTTLLRAMAGLIPSRGSIRLDGRELSGLDPAGYAREVAYMPQTLPPRVSLSVFEATLSALQSTPSAQDTDPKQKSLDVLRRLGIADLAMRGLDELSGGQRQLAGLAQCLVRQPRVLLLDEPTSALDIRHQLTVMKLAGDVARERGIVVVVVLHDIALAARWCDRIVVLSQGHIVSDGTPAQAITPAMLAGVYGVEARVERCSHGFVQVMVDAVRDGSARDDSARAG